MGLKQSYIFVKDKYKQNCNVNLFSIFKEIFELEEESITIGKNLIAEKTKKINNNKYTVVFDGKVEENTYYLNIKLDGEYNDDTITILKEYDNMIYQKKEKLEQSHICINTYSEVSQYYCNRIYKDFSKFERNLRQLMFNIYIKNCGEEFLNVISPEVYDEIRSKAIKNKDVSKLSKEEINIKVIKSSFYNLDYYLIITLLFTKRWTKLEEEEKDKFLSKYKDNLSNLPKEEFIEFINSMKPKSDWERMFADKINYKNIDKDIRDLQGKRNKVAHCKILSYQDYIESKKKLDKLNELIINAIDETENPNFKNENMKNIQNSYLLNFIDSIETFSNAVSKCFDMSKNIINKVNYFNNEAKTLGNMFNQQNYDNLFALICDMSSNTTCEENDNTEQYLLTEDGNLDNNNETDGNKDNDDNEDNDDDKDE